MQEGIISLMQMPRTIAALQTIEDAKLPHIVILTNPTTGGVTASFAMLEIPYSRTWGYYRFCWKRVIEKTVKEKLPDNFQTSEYLLEHGMVDIVADRKQHREILSNILDITLSNKK